MDAGDQILRPRLDDDERLHDNGDAEQCQDATERDGDGAPPAARAGQACRRAICNVEAHAASRI